MSLHRQLRPLQSLVRSTVAGLVAFAVFALAILSVSPEAHAWIHGQEDHDHAEHQPAPGSADHVCAVTLAQQGFCDTTPALPGVGAPADIVERSTLISHAVRWTAPEHWLQPAQGPPVAIRTKVAR